MVFFKILPYILIQVKRFEGSIGFKVVTSVNMRGDSISRSLTTQPVAMSAKLDTSL